MASSPAYAKYPEHQVDVRPNDTRVRVEFGGESIADSTRGLRVLESRHDPVVYVPRDEVQMHKLERTEHTTFCPFKGHATYYSVRVGDRVAENAVWSYEDPYDEVAGLADHVAFYVDRVDAYREE